MPVDHYAALLADDTLPSEALCLTAVRGIGVPEALVRFGGFADSRRTSVDLRNATASVYPDLLPVVVAGEIGGWTYLLEDNGWYGSLPGTLSPLSKGTVAVSAYWNVNRVSRLSYAEDGRLLASYDFVVRGGQQGEDPDRIQPYLAGLTFADPYRNTAEALAFVERVTGVRITREWLRESHPASVVVEATTFEPPGMDAWLDRAAPDIATAASEASRHGLRAAASHAVATVGLSEAKAGWAMVVDPDAIGADERAGFRARLLAPARDEYRQALELRWDRSMTGHIADPIARLQAAHTSQRGPSAAERESLARAHAWGAALARLHDEPRQSLIWVLVNAYRADQHRWPRLRDQVTRLLASRLR